MKYILIIMMFNFNGGTHSQQVEFSKENYCELAKLKVEGAASLKGAYGSAGLVKAECLAVGGDDED